jgi:hypothetical protein
MWGLGRLRDPLPHSCLASLPLFYHRESRESKRHGASQCGSLNNALNPTLGLKTHFFKGGKDILHTCLHTTSDNDQTRRHKKHKSPTKHHHHGGGAARPSSGVDLMNLRRLRSGRPCTFSFRCPLRSDLTA